MQLKYSYLPLLLIILLSSCAIKKAPSGGPKDVTPPKVTSSFPEHSSLNVEQLKYIFFEFSEPVKTNTIKQSLRISPSLNYNPKFKWQANRRVKIFINDTLKKHTTYVISLGTETKDFHEIKMAEPFVLAFSTDTLLHISKIFGNILNKNKKDNIALSIYNSQEISSADSAWYLTEPFTTLNTNLDGSFKLQYIKPGGYRLLAYVDKNLDKKFTPFTEPYAIFNKDISLNFNGDSVKNLISKTVFKDTSKTEIQKIKIISPGELEITFTTPTIVKNVIVNSISQKNKIPVLFSQESTAKKTIPLFIQNYIDKDSLLILTISDKNISQKEIEYTPPKDSLLKPKCNFNGIKNLYIEDSVKIAFSNPIDSTSFKNAVKLNLLNKNIKFFTFWRNYKNIEIIPQDGWQFEKEYELSVDFSKLKDFWQQGFKDTIINYKIATISEDEMGAIAGFFNPEPPTKQTTLLIKNIKNKKNYLRYFTKTKNNNKNFELINLPEGEYQIEGWFDKNGNKKWDSGKLDPFTFSETIFKLSDTIRVRKRWIKEGIQINF